MCAHVQLRIYKIFTEELKKRVHSPTATHSARLYALSLNFLKIIGKPRATPVLTLTKQLLILSAPTTTFKFQDEIYFLFTHFALVHLSCICKLATSGSFILSNKILYVCPTSIPTGVPKRLFHCKGLSKLLSYF